MSPRDLTCCLHIRKSAKSWSTLEQVPEALRDHEYVSFNLNSVVFQTTLQAGRSGNRGVRFPVGARDSLLLQSGPAVGPTQPPN